MSHPLLSTLDSVRDAQRKQVLLRGALRTFALVVVVGLLLAGIDYALNLRDTGLRWLLAVCWLVASLLGGFRWLWQPMQRRPSNQQLAARIEHHHPELRDRLQSAVAFFQRSPSTQVGESQSLQRTIIHQATDWVARRPVATLMRWKSLRRPTAMASGLLVVLLLLAVFAPRHLAAGTARLLSPWNDTPWPRTHQLVLRNAPTQLAVGDTFVVEVIDRNGTLPQTATIAFRIEDRPGEIETQPLSLREDCFLGVRDGIRQGFAFRVYGGDDDTMPWQKVKVIQPPRVNAWTIKAKPPAYLGVAPRELQPPLEVVAGSKLSFECEVSQSLQAAEWFCPAVKVCR